MKRHTYIRMRVKALIIMMLVVALISSFVTVKAVKAITAKNNIIEISSTDGEIDDNPDEQTIIDEQEVEIVEDEESADRGLVIPGDFTRTDIEAMARTLYGEARYGAVPEVERSMVVWTILNRLDAGRFGDSIYGICVAEYQFVGYSPENPVTEEDMELVLDVIDRWQRERNGAEDVGRTLPNEYCYFVADSDPEENEWHNAFYAYDEDYNEVWYNYREPISNPYI